MDAISPASSRSPRGEGKSSASISEASAFVPTLLSIAKQTRAIFGLKLSAAGFHNGQDQMLLALRPDSPTTVSHLADTLGVRPSTVSKMLDRLMEKGLMERYADTRDARKTMVRITPAGMQAQLQVQKVWDTIGDEFSHSIGDGAGALTAELTKLDRHLAAKLLRLR